MADAYPALEALEPLVSPIRPREFIFTDKGAAHLCGEALGPPGGGGRRGRARLRPARAGHMVDLPGMRPPRARGAAGGGDGPAPGRLVLALP